MTCFKKLKKSTQEQMVFQPNNSIFPLLYTSLPKDFSIEKLNWCLEKAFIGSKKKFISVYSNEAKFVNCPRDNTVHFSLDQKYFQICY